MINHVDHLRYKLNEYQYLPNEFVPAHILSIVKLYLETNTIENVNKILIDRNLNRYLYNNQLILDLLTNVKSKLYNYDIEDIIRLYIICDDELVRIAKSNKYLSMNYLVEHIVDKHINHNNPSIFSTKQLEEIELFSKLADETCYKNAIKIYGCDVLWNKICLNLNW